MNCELVSLLTISVFLIYSRNVLCCYYVGVVAYYIYIKWCYYSKSRILCRWLMHCRTVEQSFVIPVEYGTGCLYSYQEFLAFHMPCPRTYGGCGVTSQLSVQPEGYRCVYFVCFCRNHHRVVLLLYISSPLDASIASLPQFLPLRTVSMKVNQGKNCMEKFESISYIKLLG